MDIQTLMFFKTIADTGSFTAASESLHYAQSNLSTQIRKLEQEMGSPLFIRNKKGVSLTSKGKLFYDYVEKILALVDEAQSVMTDMDRAVGNLSLGSIEATALTFLPAFLQNYHKKYPDVTLSLRTEINDVFLNLVLNHQLDGAFVAGPANHPELAEIDITDEELILVGSADGQDLTASDILRNETLITFPEGSVFRRRLELLISSLAIPYAERLTVINTLSAMITNITAGLGFGYLTKSLVNNYINDGIMREYPLDDPYSAFKVVFIYRRDHIKNAAFKYFLQMLKSN